MSKYTPLRDHLLSLKPDHWSASFSEIEEVLGFSLPASARKFPAWWANQNPRSHVQCSGWLDAGWRASNLNLTAERVTFLNSGGQLSGLEAHDYKPTKSTLEWDDVLKSGAAKAPIALHLTFDWRLLGNVFIDQKNRITFPRTPIGPAIYRLTLMQDDTSECYIGETDEISRRFQHYRTPGVTQRTNQRLNTLMIECLKNGGSVDVAVIKTATVKWDAASEQLNFTEKLQRRLIEHAAIVSVQWSNQPLLNL